LGGWFNPGALTPERFANGFERVDGIHSGFRLNHTKGVCVDGSFESNGRGTRKAAVFKTGRVPIIGRFSLAGGNPYVADAPEFRVSMDHSLIMGTASGSAHSCSMPLG
jgi:catalase